jgi:hypothetical protein
MRIAGLLALAGAALYGFAYALVKVGVKFTFSVQAMMVIGFVVFFISCLILVSSLLGV